MLLRRFPGTAAAGNYFIGPVLRQTGRASEGAGACRCVERLLDNPSASPHAQMPVEGMGAKQRSPPPRQLGQSSRIATSVGQ